MKKYPLLFLAVAVALGGCQQPGPTVYLADGSVVQDADWPMWDRAKAMAVMPLWKDRASSHHLVRLAGSEKPHVHDTHDLTVFVLKGRVRMHLGERSVDLKPGDVVQVPHGLRHWAQNLGPGAGEAYVIFSPFYDGRDKRLVD
ncbi:MAG: cupin domain-containing protein [Phycisphaeraceae bacterium]|nr:cupin domain-containing protein [Phycisphaeraceae bacterium]